MSNYLSVLWRRKWIILFTTMIVVVVVVVGMRLIPRTYEASATIRVAKGNNERIDYGALLYSERLINTYAAMVKSGPALEQLHSQLNSSISPKIETEFPANTELMKIVVTDKDPLVATQAANILANYVISISTQARDRTAYRVTLVDPATEPARSTVPREDLGIALGLIAGLIAGLGLALLFERLDTRLYSTAHIEATTSLSTLGRIPKSRRWRKTGLLNGNSPEAEAFRHLRTNLLMIERDTPLHTILITSAEANEGKSTIAANLAYAMAQCGRKVVVVDGDLRLPRQHALFGLPNKVGLSSILRQETDLESAIQHSDPAGVSVITSGPSPSNPAELLVSAHMSLLIEELTTIFDLIIVDAPSLLAVTDATTLAMHADGVLLVISRNQGRQETVVAAREQLRRIKAQSLGIVVNRAERLNSYEYYQRKNGW